MASTSTTETWDAAWTLTMRAKRKRLTENFFDSYPTLEAFRSSGSLEMENGGKEIQEDILYAGNSAEYFSGYDVLNTDAVDGITAAFYPFRYASCPITINHVEEMENRKTDAAMKRYLDELTVRTMKNYEGWKMGLDLDEEKIDWGKMNISFGASPEEWIDICEDVNLDNVFL